MPKIKGLVYHNEAAKMPGTGALLMANELNRLKRGRPGLDWYIEGCTECNTYHVRSAWQGGQKNYFGGYIVGAKKK